MKKLPITVAGYILMLNLAYVCDVACQILSHQSSSTNSPSSTATLTENDNGNVTWIRITTLNPHKILNNSCENCSKIDFDEWTFTENQQQQRKRKRRRNRKPHRTRDDTRRIPEDRALYKKHSTRVRLEKPVKFVHVDDVHENSIEPDVSVKQNRFESTSTTVKTVPRYSSPVRYLLPPFVDKYFSGNSEINEQSQKKAEKEDWWINNRGSTKFKDTVYYKEDPEINEIVNSVSSTDKSNAGENRRGNKPNFKPIVVQPVIGLDAKNLNYNNFDSEKKKNRGLDKTKLVSQEVANAGMAVIDMKKMGYHSITENYSHHIQDSLENFEQPVTQQGNELSKNQKASQSRFSTATPQHKSYSRAMIPNVPSQTEEPFWTHPKSQVHPVEPPLQSYTQIPGLVYSRVEHENSLVSPNVSQRQEFSKHSSSEQTSSVHAPHYKFVESQLHFSPSHYSTTSRQIHYDLTARQQHQEIKKPGFELLPPLLPLPQVDFENNLFNFELKNQFSTSSQAPYFDNSPSTRGFIVSYQSETPEPRHSQLQSQHQQHFFMEVASVNPINYESQISSQQQRQSIIEHSTPRGLNEEENQRRGHQNRRPQSGSYHFTTTEAISTRPILFSTVTTNNNSNNATKSSNKKKQSKGKGLELAESKYFSDLPSEQEIAPLFQNEGEVIPGSAGRDYPVFGQHLLQKRRFSCRGLEGYFADVSTRCQVFYICNGNGAGEPMLCPNGTLFSQEFLVCDWWYNVDC